MCYENIYSTGARRGVTWQATKTTSSVSLLDYNLDRVAEPESDEYARGSYGYGVSAAGVFVGGASKTVPTRTGKSDVSFPVVSSGGGWTIVAEPVLPDVPANQPPIHLDAFAYQMNAEGTILGMGNLGPDRAILTSGGSYQVLDIAPGEKGLNNLGHVVGHTPGSVGTPVARLWNGATYENLDTSLSYAVAINDSGFAVGRRGHTYDNVLTGSGMLYRSESAPVSLSWWARRG